MKGAEQVADDAARLGRHAHNLVMPVKMGTQESS